MEGLGPVHGAGRRDRPGRSRRVQQGASCLQVPSTGAAIGDARERDAC